MRAVWFVDLLTTGVEFVASEARDHQLKGPHPLLKHPSSLLKSSTLPAHPSSTIKPLTPLANPMPL
jgi:hypothetical protein